MFHSVIVALLMLTVHRFRFILTKFANWSAKMKFSLVCICVVFGLFKVAVAVQCPQQCRCAQSQVQCSHLSATKIAHIPADTKTL